MSGKKAVEYAAKHGCIINRHCQIINKTTRKTSMIDLSGLVKKACRLSAAKIQDNFRGKITGHCRYHK
jgi:hypothetical protein